VTAIAEAAVIIYWVVKFFFTLVIHHHLKSIYLTAATERSNKARSISIFICCRQGNPIRQRKIGFQSDEQRGEKKMEAEIMVRDLLGGRQGKAAGKSVFGIVICCPEKCHVK